jgi:acylphosphatase
MTEQQTAASALRALVRGRVQGVGFRAYVQRRAGELGLKGFARNLSDGITVEVVAEGGRPALEALLAALRLGPSGANVERVDATWSESTNAFSRFETR